MSLMMSCCRSPARGSHSSSDDEDLMSCCDDGFTPTATGANAKEEDFEIAVLARVLAQTDCVRMRRKVGCPFWFVRFSAYRRLMGSRSQARPTGAMRRRGENAHVHSQRAISRRRGYAVERTRRRRRSFPGGAVARADPFERASERGATL